MTNTPPSEDQPTEAPPPMPSESHQRYFRAHATMMELNAALVARGPFAQNPLLAQALAFLNGSGMVRETEVIALVSALEKAGVLKADDFFDAFCERAALVGQEVTAAVKEVQSRPKILVAQAEIPRGGRPS